MLKTLLPSLESLLVVVEEMQVVGVLKEDLNDGEVHFDGLHNVLVGTLNEPLLGLLHNLNGVFEKGGDGEVRLLVEGSLLLEEVGLVGVDEERDAIVLEEEGEVPFLLIIGEELDDLNVGLQVNQFFVVVYPNQAIVERIEEGLEVFVAYIFFLANLLHSR